MEHCKSLEINLMFDNELIPSVIERAIEIIRKHTYSFILLL